jgi:hypothetical protein
MSANLSAPPHRAGSTSIAVVATAPSGLDLQTSGFDTTGQQTLRLSLLNVNGDVNGFYIALCAADGTPIRYVRAADYTGAGALYQASWWDLVMPLADLQAANKTIAKLLIQTTGPASFYVDEISFSAVSGSSYWLPPTVTSVTLSCSPASVQPGGTSQCTKTLAGTWNPDTSVTWSVDGVPNGNATVGIVDLNHLTIYPTYLIAPYVAPTTVSGPTTVTVTATSVLDPTKFGSATVSIVAPPPPPPPPASGELYTTSLYNDPALVSYYRFEGNANDSKGTNNGMGTNVAYGTNYGKFGQGAMFSNQNSYVSINPSPLPRGSSPFSAFVWLKYTTIGSANGEQVLLDYGTLSVGGLFRLTFNASGIEPGFNSLPGPATSQTVPPDGNWHLFGATYSGGANGILIDYLDGNIVASGAITGTPNLGADTAHIGIYVNQSSMYGFTGDMDDFFILSRVLSPAEVAGLYSGSSVPPPTQQATQASDAVFTDAPGIGWAIAGQMTVTAMSDFAYRGDYGMLAQATTYGTSTQFVAQSGYKFSTTGYNYLSLAVNIGTYEGESLSVGLLNAAGNVIQSVPLASYTSDQTLYPYDWQVVNIPLSILNPANADVYGVSIVSANPATFSIDELKFAGGCQ